MARAEEWGLERGAPDDFEAFWANYTAWLRFRDLGVDADRCRELVEMQGEHSFATMFRAVLSAYAEQADKPRVGEKTPGHARYLDCLFEWFPDAQVLFTQRDPRAVVASQLKTYYVKENLTPRSLREGIFTGERAQEIVFKSKDWVENFDVYLKPWRSDPRVRTVVYENLVQRTEEEVRAVFEFLGERFEPAVLADRSEEVPPPAAEDKDSRMEEWRVEHHARSLQRVSPDSLDKWCDDLAPSELAMVEGLCGETMEAHGYETSLPERRRLTGRVAATALEASGAAEQRMRHGVYAARRRAGKLRRSVGTALTGLVDTSIEQGLAPGWLGYRRVLHETVREYFRRRGDDPAAGTLESVHPESVADNPLPCNVNSADELPDQRGWWGYSFRDVPRRTSGETFIATLPDCLVCWYRNPAVGNDFYPAILNKDRRALDMREIRFRPRHAAVLRDAPGTERLERATWFAERVYHNHSHWLTAHLPKLLLLRERGLLGDILLPPERTAAIDGSLKMLGIEPEQLRTYDLAKPLRVDQLTIVGTDRFRPELLRLVPAAFGVNEAPSPDKKIFISREGAARRRLVNEDEVWAQLAPHGFERVRMEELDFAAQVALMRSTAVLVAPHGAGLTNMIFCPRGAHIVEIADLGFPNPNFYALASAMGHRYWLVQAESRGDVHPLEKDLFVDPAAVARVLPALQLSAARKGDPIGQGATV